MRELCARVHGKWILAGEHAVLRGCPALAFPMLGKSLNLIYRDDGERLSAEFSGEHGAELHLLFWGVMERALAAKGIARANLTGHFSIENGVPIGAGLGASAALCVAIVRWFEWNGWTKGAELYEFARGLEDLFHGESSGLDVAVALGGHGLRFVRGATRDRIRPAWRPRWYLSYSGKRGITSECVSKVKELFETDRARAEALDARMRSAVARAEEALQMQQGFEDLRAAIDEARSCFEDWGLADGAMGEHLADLKAAGAAAAKPTGSGDGGFALSLWRESPDAAVARFGLIDAGVAD